MEDDRRIVDVSSLDVFCYTRPDGTQDYQDGFEDGVSFVLDKLDKLPSVRRYARVVRDGCIDRCSECHDRLEFPTHKYCPECGALFVKEDPVS